MYRRVVVRCLVVYYAVCLYTQSAFRPNQPITTDAVNAMIFSVRKKRLVKRHHLMKEQYTTATSSGDGENEVTKEKDKDKIRRGVNRRSSASAGVTDKLHQPYIKGERIVHAAENASYMKRHKPFIRSLERASKTSTTNSALHRSKKRYSWRCCAPLSKNTLSDEQLHEPGPETDVTITRPGYRLQEPSSHTACHSSSSSLSSMSGTTEPMGQTDVSSRDDEELDIVATEDMCGWCFAVLCYYLNRNDTEFSGGRATASRDTRNGSTAINNSPHQHDEELTSLNIPESPSFGRNTTPRFPPPPQSVEVYKRHNVRVPLFVSWMTVRKKCNGTITRTLKGCIGSLEPVPIEDLSRYAYRAAFKDRRFKPITSEDLSELECHVSLLHSFQPCLHPYDWDINVHGVTIHFNDPNQPGDEYTYQATFLPGVAKEHQMTYRSTLNELIYKSGWRKPVDDELIDCLHVTRYCASKTQLPFSKFLAEFSRAKSDNDG